MNFLRRRLFAIAAILVGAAAGWFLLVDFSWFEEKCPDCLYARTDIQYRVLTVPVRKWEDAEPTALQRAAADLGVPCHHPNLHRWQNQRWWGLLYCRCPCHHGIVGLAKDHDWYDQAAAEKLLQLAKEDPDFANSFHRRVLLKHDYSFWRSIVQQITEPEPLTND
jgi:hypothetical protein